MNFREGNKNDLKALKELALRSWSIFKNDLTEENWEKLHQSLQDNQTYVDLLNTSYCLVCENNNGIIGMAFLVAKGNPTEIYDKEWSYIRFISVDPDFSGKGIGKKLTAKCIEIAKNNNENIIALHTSELMKNAIHIYESLGFKILKEIPERLGKRYWLYLLNI